MKIKLTQGRYTIVDSEDFEWLSKWKWQILKGHPDYARRTGWLNGKKHTFLMHLEILKKYGLKIEKKETDHINRNGLDNRKVNLRQVILKENVLNKGVYKTNKVGYKGVSQKLNHKTKKWLAQIQLNRKKTHLGYFLTPKEAALAYNEAAKQYFGEFAYLNQIGGGI